MFLLSALIPFIGVVRNLTLFVTTQVDSLKGALPRQSLKIEGYCTWAFGPFVLPSAVSLFT